MLLNLNSEKSNDIMAYSLIEALKPFQEYLNGKEYRSEVTIPIWKSLIQNWYKTETEKCKENGKENKKQWTKKKFDALRK